MIKRKNLLIVISLLCASLPIYASNQIIDQNDLIYDYDEMLNFNTNQFLKENYPDLAPHSESITHWSGHSTVSPKILIALSIMQNDNRSYAKFDPRKPFRNLSRKMGFNNQIEDIAESIAKKFYENKANGVSEPANTAIKAILAEHGECYSLIQCKLKRN